MNIRPIIIVEDDEDDAEFLANAFIETGADCKFRCFSSPVTALEYLKTTAELPLVIISDINMPVVNGLEFKRLINEGKLLEGKAIPFIFLSTTVNMRLIREAYHLSIQGFFKKPNNIADFDIIAKSIVDYCGNSKSLNQMAC
ncbi:MAG: response regulator [Ferruginibacter sp.]|nr:response regulator [Ferruginibacter sp.]